MGRPLRGLAENVFYHIYNRGVEKRNIFLSEMDYRIFIRLLSELTAESNTRLFAYCLMKNHFHLFLQDSSAQLDKTMQKLQSRYAQYFNYSHGRVGALFQGRYKSKKVESDANALQLIRYIHRNPLETGSLIEKYQWSSYGSYVNGASFPEIDTKWVLSQFDEVPLKAKKQFVHFHGDTGV
jgi:putative transposase